MENYKIITPIFSYNLENFILVSNRDAQLNQRW
jgi:hypothetical protein